MEKKILFVAAAAILALLARQGCNLQSGMNAVNQVVSNVEQGLGANGVKLPQLPVGQANPANNPANSGVGAYSPNTPSTQPNSGGYANTGNTSPAGFPQPATGLPANATIRIGSFNIQIFGRAKLSNPDVSGILIDIARSFDVLAIQELRSTEQDLIAWFVQQINSQGRNYQSIVGYRQGHTVSKEQYVFLYDADRIGVLGEAFIAEDPEQKIHRSPMVARFQCLGLPPSEAFTFALMNIHTDPDVVPQELGRLSAIIPMIQTHLPEEDDFILLGDLNCWPSVFADYRLLQNQQALIPDEWQTNTRKDRNYDNLVIDGLRTTEWTGSSGVYDMERVYGLSRDQALEVSDHLPVWGLFQTREQRTAMAQVPNFQSQFTNRGQ